MAFISLRFEELVCQSLIHQCAGPKGWKVDEVSPAFGSVPIHVVHAENPLYVPALGLQLVDGHIVPEEVIHGSWTLDFEVEADFHGYAGPYKHPFEPKYCNLEVCVLSNFYSGNFHHWITEELIKVIILERYGFEGYYVLSQLPKFATEFMCLLGVESERLIHNIDAPTIFKSAIFTTPITADSALSYSGVFKSLRKLILTAADADSKTGLSSRLWIDRGPDVRNKGRELVNADEVYAILGRYGFEIVDMEKLTIPDQIVASYNAKILSGIHGAGFVHTLFMKPESKVIECFSPYFINTGILEICRMMNHQYFMLAHPNAYDAYPYGQRLKIYCSHLELTLQSVCQ